LTTDHRSLITDHRTLKLLLLCLPLLIAAWVVWRGAQVDPAYCVPPANAEVAATGVTLPQTLGAWQTPVLEWLPAARMFERIDGRASFYEQFGARGLLYAGWSSPAGAWDLYLYLMNDAAGARGAFLAEASGANQHFSRKPQMRGTPGSLFFLHGAAYGQLIAIQPAAPPASVTDLVARILALLPAAGDEADPSAYLRHPAVAADSLEYCEADAFGYQSLTRIYSAHAVLQEESATWFIATLSNHAAAAEIVRRYTAELRRFGASAMFTNANAAGGQMLGAWEVLAHTNTMIYGIRDAGSHTALTQHWHALQHHLQRGPTP
jgi:hypothetical protein